MATLLILALLLTVTATNTIAKPKKIVAKIIHRDSVYSPYFNPNDTIAVRTQRILNISMSRFAYMQAKFAGPKVNLLPTISILPLLLVNFSIGDPPIPQLAIMDTGSDLLWVQCVPCKSCSRQVGPMLDPSKSDTYYSFSCQVPQCSFAPRANCNSLGECIYNQSYVSGAGSVGNIATEQLVFGTPDDEDTTLFDVIFGCGHQSGKFDDSRRTTGVFGLGYGRISVIRQFDIRFSYCIGSLTDPNYAFNQLELGDNTSMLGYSTPLEMVEGFYFLSLEGISVGDRKLDIDANIFKRTTKSSRDGVIIDSGAALTYLAKGAYEVLRQEVKELSNLILTPITILGDSEELCYKGEVNEDLIGFPAVTFHFAGDADLVLDYKSSFYQYDFGVVCLAIHPSEKMKLPMLSIIGVMAQQNYNVGYDIVGKKLYFESIDCKLL